MCPNDSNLLNSGNPKEEICVQMIEVSLVITNSPTIALARTVTKRCAAILVALHLPHNCCMHTCSTPDIFSQLVGRPVQIPCHV